jgi:hypothetical protein
MDTIRCFKCNSEILPEIPFCPHCGQKQSPQYTVDGSSKDPYKILQVSPDEEDKIIEAAYRSLARKYHPDANPGFSQDERMRDINWAYEILSKPSKRKEWDTRNRAKGASEGTENSQRSNPQKVDPIIITPARGPAEATIQTENKAGGSSRKWRFIILSLFLIGLIWFCSTASGASNRPEISASANQTTTTNSLQARRTSTPGKASGAGRTATTNTSQVRRTATPGILSQRTSNAQPSCIRWDKVDDRLIGSTACVYGDVIKIYETDVYAFILRFSDEAGTFLIRSRNMYYAEVKKGACVATLGLVHRDGNYLYMQVEETELYDYSDCSR